MIVYHMSETLKLGDRLEPDHQRTEALSRPFIQALERSEDCFYAMMLTGKYMFAVLDKSGLREWADYAKWCTEAIFEYVRQREFQIEKIGLNRPRAELYARIDRRVLQMMEAGLVDEVRSLLPYRSCPALQTVGYREIFSYLDGDISLDRAVELVQQHSRNYAKRQLTWWRRETDINWISL